MTTRLHVVARLSLVPLVLAALFFAGATPADAQTAQVRYERALAREQAARKQANPTVASLRSIATAYEQIVRQFPRSGYSDNALFQAAGVLELAWERGGQTRDRDQALRYLEWLRREYPSSSLVAQSRTRTAALNRPRAASTARAANTSTPAPRPAPTTSAAASSSRAAARPAPEAPATSTPTRGENAPVTQPTSPTPAPRVETPATQAQAPRPPVPTSALAAARAAAARAAAESNGGETGPSSSPTTSTPAARPAAAAAEAPPTAPSPVPSTPATLAGRTNEAAPARTEKPAANAVSARTTPSSTAASSASRATTPGAPAPAAARPATPTSVATPEPSPSTRATPVAVRGLSHTPLPRGDRLTLELSDETGLIPGLASGANGVVLTVADARAAAAILDAARSIRGSLIESLRIDNVDEGLRLTVSVPDEVRHSSFPLYNPTRLVVDFETMSSTPRQQAAASGSEPVAAVSAAADRVPSAHVPAAPAAAISAAATATSSLSTVAAAASAKTETPDDGPVPAPPASIRGGYSLARQLGLGVSRIVIDPGHGGSDPGASGNGVTESALVLDIALRLEKLLLEQPGFEVVLTRRTNVAVPLARRTAIANEEGADLFLSIHANSSPRRETAGVETYFLNLATNPQAEAVAARENASSAGNMHTLPQLVRAITNNNKLAESRELAGAVQSSLVRRLRPRNRDFQDLGVKQAPFVVLIGAQMPSVLAEVAFLTNRAEANLLKQNAYKQQIAQALFDAIVAYRGSLKKMTPVATTAAQ